MTYEIEAIGKAFRELQSWQETDDISLFNAIDAVCTAMDILEDALNQTKSNHLRSLIEEVLKNNGLPVCLASAISFEKKLQNAIDKDDDE